MIIIGCDFHTRFQQIAMLDPITGWSQAWRGPPLPLRKCRTHSRLAASERIIRRSSLTFKTGSTIPCSRDCATLRRDKE